MFSGYVSAWRIPHNWPAAKYHRQCIKNRGTNNVPKGESTRKKQSVTLAGLKTHKPPQHTFRVPLWGRQGLLCSSNKTLFVSWKHLKSESALSFSFICWFHSLEVKNRNSLQKIVRIASKITAVPQRDLGLSCEQQILQKARVILTKKDHILIRNLLMGIRSSS